VNRRILIPPAAVALPAAAGGVHRAAAESSWATSDRQPIELRLGFRELVLLHQSLQAIRTLGLVDWQDDLVTDTLQLIDVALEEAV
jgi:hypothetical protein